MGKGHALARREQAGELGPGRRAREDVAHAVEQAPADVDADGQEGQQLDHRLEGDRRHQAFVALAAVEVARAEHHREARQRQREVDRALLPPGPLARQRGRQSGQDIEGDRDALELQRDVGHDADHRDQRDQAGQQRALAVAARDEVGDRGDAVALGDAQHLAQHQPGQHHRQHRTEVDRQEPDARAGSPAHAAEIGPGAAVDRQRQRIDPGAGDDRAPGRRAPIAESRDREQRQQIGQRDGDDQQRRHGA